MSINNNEESVYKSNMDIYGKEIRTVPNPGKEIGIDTKKTLFTNISGEGKNGNTIDINSINSFSRISLSRDLVYNMIDSMCEDTTIAAVLETYAEDATEYNDEGKIVWCESSDANISNYVNFLLDTMNVDKHIYDWAHSLCKYGDIYLRLYRNSDYKDDGLFSGQERKPLNEDVKLKVYSVNDNYSNYVEKWSNPSEVFELVKRGKTYAYIQADVGTTSAPVNGDFASNIMQYTFSKGDVNIHSATDFVHGALKDNSSRTPEKVTILKSKDGEVDLTYTVNRGQSLLYNVYKAWRELSLLENSLLLNRVTKSSIVRIVQVEVGDMPKESVGPHLLGIKQMIEQKAAINAGKSIAEYTSPGPVENNIYVPTHEGVGAITTSEIGGNPDVRSIVDIEYYQNKMFGGLRIPKQYFGLTDDGAGFNGGTSLSIISSRYAKMIKRIQNTLCQCITDAINLFLMDRGLINYINNFNIKMLPPTTLEEIDRRDNLSSKIQLAQDTMNMLSDIEDVKVKLKILKSLLSNILTNSEVTLYIQEYIDKLEKNEKEQAEETPEEDTEDDVFDDLEMPEEDSSFDLASDVMGVPEENGGEEINMESEEGGAELILPTPEEMGIDLTSNI